MDLIIKNNLALWGSYTFRCSFGRLGFTDNKAEGDGKTPIGIFPFRQVFYRPDRIERPKTALPISPISPRCGWCDDPASPDYNKYILKPFHTSHEDLWMKKNLYDLLIVVGHNDESPIPGKGSAIFIHIASGNYGPTDGCIGLKQENLLKIIKNADLSSRLIIEM